MYKALVSGDALLCDSLPAPCAEGKSHISQHPCSPTFRRYTSAAALAASASWSAAFLYGAAP
eukprot:1747270-Pyramimonas_sp.AAC.1